MSSSKDLIIAKLQKMNDEKDGMIIQLLDENETLETLIKEVKGTLKDFKRQVSGKQMTDLFNRILSVKEIDKTKVMKQVVACVLSQRASRGGLSKVFKRYMRRNSYQLPERWEIEQYSEYAFHAFSENAQADANMALSVISSMLVVLLDIEEEKSKVVVEG